MKKNIILLTMLGMVAFFSCKKDEDQVILDSQKQVNAPSIISPVSGDSIVVKSLDSLARIQFAWDSVDYGIKTQVNYYIQIDVAGNNFAKYFDLAVLTTDTFSINVRELNDKLLTKLGLTPNATSAIDIRIMAMLYTNTDTVISSTSTIKFHTYKFIPKPVEIKKPAFLYIPGGYQASGGDPSKDDALNIYTVSGPDSLKKYEGYVYFAAGTWIKFTKTPDWGHTNYGEGGGGKLSTDGAAAGIDIAASGFYKLNVDVQNLTYTAVLINSWGLIGTATTGGWNTSTPMTYDATNKVWTITTNLVAGALKFRANDGWDINYGPENSGDLIGNLKSTDAAISITEAGNYTVTIDFTRSTSPYLKYTYKVVKN